MGTKNTTEVKAICRDCKKEFSSKVQFYYDSIPIGEKIQVLPLLHVHIVVQKMIQVCHSCFTVEKIIYYIQYLRLEILMVLKE